MSIIKNVPVSERPYEKCFEHGPEVLTDKELIAVILRNGTVGMGAYDLAGQIMSIGSGEQSLISLMHLSKEELMNIKGIGKVKAIQILCICELAKRISMVNAKEGFKLDKPSTIAQYYMERMRHLDKEELIVLYANTKCQLIKDVIMTIGTVNQSFISPREIFIEGLKCNAVTIILLHNHPSGDCTPSKSDIVSTERLVEAGKLIGINVLDHIIIGDRRYSSLKELKLIK